jgi:hypothetical protein
VHERGAQQRVEGGDGVLVRIVDGLNEHGHVGLDLRVTDDGANVLESDAGGLDNL